MVTREWGIDISSGTIGALLSADQDTFRAEKDAPLETQLATASYLRVEHGAPGVEAKAVTPRISAMRVLLGFNPPIHRQEEPESRTNFLELLCAGIPATGSMITGWPTCTNNLSPCPARHPPDQGLGVNAPGYRDVTCSLSKSLIFRTLSLSCAPPIAYLGKWEKGGRGVSSASLRRAVTVAVLAHAG